MAKKQGRSDKGESHAHGWAVTIAMWVAGIGGMVLAGYAADRDQFVGAGFCLLVSVLAFGQLLRVRGGK